MAWIDDVLKSEYSLIRVLKNTKDKTITVFRHNTLGKSVVCKKFKGNADVYKRLKRYACPNLPEVYDVFENGTEITVLEEYIDGVTVGDILSGGLYTESGVRTVIKGVCSALSVLHSVGIIHRDIKPENIMITNEGNVKVIDFDAARIFKQGKSADTRVMGTVGYAAPEQFGLAQSDERTDVFSVGVLMNVMLTGEHPGKRMYNGRLSRVISKAICVDPDKRYASVQELKKYL